MSASIAAADTPASQPSTQPVLSATEAAAEDATRQYIDLLHNGKGIDAIKTYWDFDAIFNDAFGDDMKQVSDADRAQMRSMITGLIGTAYADPRVNEMMAKSTFDILSAEDLPDHRVVVEFTVHVPSGQAIDNVLDLVQESTGWRVVNASTNGSSMNDAMRNDYKNSRKGTTPLQFVRAMTGG